MRKEKPTDCVTDKNKIASAAQFSLTYSQRHVHKTSKLDREAKEKKTINPCFLKHTSQSTGSVHWDVNRSYI